MTQTQWTFKDENRKETCMQERWRENTPRMMQKDVDACRQWVIFLFINEWAGLGKGSFGAYHPSPVWQASSLKGLSPHWQPSPCSVFLIVLGSHPHGGANLSPELSLTEDPCSLNIRDLLCFRKISSVNSRCPWFSSPLLFPLLLQPGRISHYPPIESLPSLGFGSEYRTPPPRIWNPCLLFSVNNCVFGDHVEICSAPTRSFSWPHPSLITPLLRYT